MAKTPSREFLDRLLSIAESARFEQEEVELPDERAFKTFMDTFTPRACIALVQGLIDIADYAEKKAVDNA